MLLYRKYLSKKVTYIILFVILVFLIVASGCSKLPLEKIPGNGTVLIRYYVNQSNPAASDENPGTEDKPWLTVQHAFESVSAGSLVIVKGNNSEYPLLYDEWVNIPDSLSGKEGQPIILKAEPENSVIIQGINTNKCDYLRIEGFEISNKNTSWDKKTGIFLNSSNVQIINNHFYDLRYYPAIRSGGSCNNIVVKNNLIERCNMGMWCSGDNWLVEDNTVYRLIRGEFGDDADYVRVFGSNHRYIGNKFYGTDFSEIGNSHVDGFQTFNIGGEGQEAHNILISGNILMDFHQGIMMRDTTCEGIEGAVSRTHTDWTVINNVFARSNSYGVCINNMDGINLINNTFYDMKTYGIGISYCKDAKVFNNIVQRSVHPFSLDGNYEGYEEDYNLIYDWQTFQVNGADGVHDQVGVDPLLFDPENEEFILKEGSPAINKGMDSSVYGFTEDLNGINRPYGNGWDIGAYEYTGG